MTTHRSNSFALQLAATKTSLLARRTLASFSVVACLALSLSLYVYLSFLQSTYSASVFLHGSSSLSQENGLPSPFTARHGDHPRVALLFLSRGALPLEPIWKDFFDSASLLPDPQGPPVSPPQPIQRPMREYYSAAKEKERHADAFPDHSATRFGSLRRLSSILMGESSASSHSSGGVSTTLRHSYEASESRLSAKDTAGPIHRQSLFTVHVHTDPTFAFPPDSIFSGYQIDNRVLVQWGQYSLAEAERRLLKAAMEDPRNQRFLLISDSCVPLYPPDVLWAQVLSEQRSRVKACAVNTENSEDVRRRWSPLARPANGSGLSFATFRKSSQWKMLLRSHAQLVAEDGDIWPLFAEYCYSHVPGRVPLPPWLDPETHPPTSTCVADEHLVATILAHHRQAPMTTCLDSMTHTDWKPGMWSPVVYEPRYISTSLLKRLRHPECKAARAKASATQLFFYESNATLNGMGDDVTVMKQGENGTASSSQYTYPMPLDQDCPLFARKFAADAVDALVTLARDCSDQGLGLSPECFSKL